MLSKYFGITCTPQMFMSKVALKLDLRDVRAEEDFHDRATVTFDLPHYYGRNRDAFWDCLTEIVEPTVVRVCGLDLTPDDLEWPLLEYIEMLKAYEAQSDGRFFVMIE